MNAPITVGLIILTCISSIYTINNPYLIGKYTMNPLAITRYKQYYRLITSGFIHSGYMHLGFNMFTFFFFGSVVEQMITYQFGIELGSVLFIGLYIISIVVSDLPTLWRFKDSTHYNSLGASGAVATMVFSSILLFPLNHICLFAILCLPGFLLGILYLIYTYTQGKQMSDNINHQAHFTGAIFGIVITLVLFPSSGAEFFRQIITYRIF